MPERTKRRRRERALLDAVRLDNTELARSALDAGAEVNCRDTEHGETPLMLARSEAMTRLLLERGAEVDARDTLYGHTALMANGHALLLTHGADVDRQDNEGNTALMHAVSRYETEKIERLLEAGANLYLTNSFGETALSLAEQYGFSELVERLKSASLPREETEF